MHHEISYVSCNCNQTPTVAHWGKNALICYAASNAVMIYDPKWGSGGKVVATLIGHTKRVNSVRWIFGNDDNELVSGSTDHTAIVWSCKDGVYTPTVLKGHASNVNIVDGLHKNNATVIVTVGMDSTVKIWVRTSQSEEFIMSQDINYGYSICVGVRISFLPHSDTLILACAVDNCKIDLYVEDEQFNLCLTLKGHEDWVRGLDFTTDKNDLILASSSQDCYIRLWRMTPHDSDQSDADNLIKTKTKTYRVYTDSILTGHEGWVYSVNWSPTSPQLLSSSLDKTMIIWELDPDSNLWVEKIRVGEVGGNTLGFYGGVFNPDGTSILAHSYNGAFHIWQNVNGDWSPCVTVGGHFREVSDLSWEPKGEFLVSVSADQTTRIHAPWSKPGEAVTWHEIARPQIHGYDMSSVAMLSRYKFASSAEEKVIRTFQAPQNFIENFTRICKVLDDGGGDSGAKGASVPSLGLSNKAVFANEGNGESEDSHFTAVNLTAPPTEETLLQNTLWPETQKLYGHGYEVYSLASSLDGKLLASACKATSLEHAAILLWETSTWRQVQKLMSHTLTVAQMSFSPDSQHLLSVSRDRRWSLFTKNSQNLFELVATTDKKTSIHTRIIWCCAWTHDSVYFATGSRDGKIVMWTRNQDKADKGVLGEYEAASKFLELKNDSVTAVAFAPKCVIGGYLLAAGFETGVIQCYKWSPKDWEKIIVLGNSLAHHLTVKRLAFRPVCGRAGHKNDDEFVLQLASCGSDHTVRIHDFVIK